MFDHPPSSIEPPASGRTATPLFMITPAFEGGKDAA